MGWSDPTPDPQDRETWRSAVLPWQEVGEPDHATMLAWYRRLIALRAERPELRDPALSSVDVRVVDADTVVMTRGGRVRVAATRGDGAQVDLGEGRILAAWGDVADLGGGRYRLGGPGAVVVG
jgi:maltooligosyltrehalose trehalohydrolase